MEILDITVAVEADHHAIFNIFKHTRPDWDSEMIVIKELHGGHVNQIYYCRLSNDTEEDDVVLVKVYGAGTGEWLDRDKEVTSLLMAHRVGVGSPLYCRFQNGLAYKYYRGNIGNSENITGQTFARGVARKLAALHHFEPDIATTGFGGRSELNKVPIILTFVDMVKKWSVLPEFKDSYVDQFKEKVRLMEFPSKADAIKLVEVLGKELEEMGFPTCFCHSDPHAANIIYDPKTGEVHLVDWEVSGIDYAAHDIGWYFAGRILVDDCADGGLKFYPDKAYQFKWIRWYLEYSAELRGQTHETITEADINNLYKGSILCALIRIIGVVVYFRMLDAKSPSDPYFFRKARYFQRLFRIVMDEHCQK